MNRRNARRKLPPGYTIEQKEVRISYGRSGTADEKRARDYSYTIRRPDGRIITITSSRGNAIETAWLDYGDNSGLGMVGGKADRVGKRPSDFDREQLHIGEQVELEHTGDRHLAREIAMDHLTERSDYYEKLNRAGLIDGLDDPIVAKCSCGKTYTADEFQKLHFVGRQRIPADPDDPVRPQAYTMELRDCTCKSTIAAELDE